MLKVKCYLISEDLQKTLNQRTDLTQDFKLFSNIFQKGNVHKISRAKPSPGNKCTLGLLDSVNETEFAKDDIPNTCQQVSMFNASGMYVEFILEHIPFCDLVWCGFSSEVTQELMLSAWSCMLSRYDILMFFLVAYRDVLQYTLMKHNYPSCRHSRTRFD